MCCSKLSGPTLCGFFDCFATMALVATLSAVAVVVAFGQQIPDPGFELSELLERRPETYRTSSWGLSKAPYLTQRGQPVTNPSSLTTVTVAVDPVLYPPAPSDLTQEVVWLGAPFTASVASLVTPVLTTPRNFRIPEEVVTLGAGEVDQDCSTKTARVPAAGDMYGTRTDLTPEECTRYFCSRSRTDWRFTISHSSTICSRCNGSWGKTAKAAFTLLEIDCKVPIDYNLGSGTVTLAVRPAGIAMTVGADAIRFGHIYNRVPRFVQSIGSGPGGCCIFNGESEGIVG